MLINTGAAFRMYMANKSRAEKLHLYFPWLDIDQINGEANGLVYMDEL